MLQKQKLLWLLAQLHSFRYSVFCSILVCTDLFIVLSLHCCYYIIHSLICFHLFITIHLSYVTPLYITTFLLPGQQLIIKKLSIAHKKRVCMSCVLSLDSEWI